MNNYLTMKPESNLMLAGGEDHHPQAHCLME